MIWQTTNQQPWTEAVVRGILPLITKSQKPQISVGDYIFLHNSQKILWKDLKGMKWLKDYKINPNKAELGMIVAMATVKEVSKSSDTLTERERSFWDVDYVHSEPNGHSERLMYNCAEDWTIRLDNIIKLRRPIKAQGFNTHFIKPPDRTYQLVLKNNPQIADILNLQAV